MIPSIMELMPSVLKILADADPHTKKEIDNAIAAEFGVTDSEMKEKISCGANKFKNRMGWALINLKNKNLLIKEGKEYRITEVGIRAVSAAPNRLTAKFLKSLNKPEESEDDSDDTPKGAAGGGSSQEQPAVAPEPAEPSVDEVPEVSDPEGEAPVTETASSVDLSMYAGLDQETEFMLAVRAKVGDRIAFKKLWEKYRSMMVGMFRHCKNLTIDERVSEAALVFVKKIELFQPEKIGKTPEAWIFSYMLTGGVKNARDKIIRHSRKDAKYNFDFDEEIADYDNTSASIVGKTLPIALDVNRFEYEEKYNPEIHALRAADVSLEEKQRALMEKLTPLQITILQFRQAGKTVQEIADEMGCGFTKVRLNIVKARELASLMFGVSYS